MEKKGFKIIQENTSVDYKSMSKEELVYKLLFAESKKQELDIIDELNLRN